MTTSEEISRGVEVMLLHVYQHEVEARANDRFLQEVRAEGLAIPCGYETRKIDRWLPRTVEIYGAADGLLAVLCALSAWGHGGIVPGN